MECLTSPPVRGLLWSRVALQDVPPHLADPPNPARPPRRAGTWAARIRYASCAATIHSASAAAALSPSTSRQVGLHGAVGGQAEQVGHYPWRVGCGRKQDGLLHPSACEQQCALLRTLSQLPRCWLSQAYIANPLAPMQGAVLAAGCGAPLCVAAVKERDGTVVEDLPQGLQLEVKNSDRAWKLQRACTLACCPRWRSSGSTNAEQQVGFSSGTILFH